MFAGAWFSGLGVNHDLDFAEVDRVAFRLEADTTALNQKVFSVFNKWFGGLVVWVVLWLGITENGFAIDLVLDHLRTLHYDLSDNPLLAMHGVGCRIDAVGLYQLIFHHHMGARGAKVSGGAGIFAIATEKLDLNTDGKFLVFVDGGRILAVDHHAAIAGGPAWAPFHLITHKTVLNAQGVMAEGLLVKKVAEACPKIVVTVVAHLQQAVFDAEGVFEVVTQIEGANFRGPAGKILAIEKLEPLAGLRTGILCLGQRGCKNAGAKGDSEPGKGHVG